MPMYEYCCSSCGNIEEHIVSHEEKDTKDLRCSECNSKLKRNEVSSCAFHLKGSGWYVTDYKKSSELNKKRKSK